MNLYKILTVEQIYGKRPDRGYALQGLTSTREGCYDTLMLSWAIIRALMGAYSSVMLYMTPRRPLNQCMECLDGRNTGDLCYEN